MYASLWYVDGVKKEMSDFKKCYLWWTSSIILIIILRHIVIPNSIITEIGIYTYIYISLFFTFLSKSKSKIKKILLVVTTYLVWLSYILIYLGLYSYHYPSITKLILIGLLIHAILIIIFTLIKEKHNA